MVEEKKFCPTCGQPMKLIETIKEEHPHPKKPPANNKEEPLKLFQIWRCLNCSEDWRINFRKGTLERIKLPRK